MDQFSNQETPAQDRNPKRRHRRLSILINAFGQALHEWAERSTFHGISAVFSSKTGILRRGFWLLFIGISIYGLYYGSAYQIHRYLDFKTVNKETIRSEDILTYPAITICSTCVLHNNSFGDDTDLRLMKDLYSGQNKTTLLDMYDEEYLRSFKISKFYETHSVPIDEMMYFCGRSTGRLNCSEYIRGRVLESVGLCYTMNGDSNNTLKTYMIGNSNSLYFVLFANQEAMVITQYANAGFRVVIHDQNEDPDLSQALFLSPGFSYSIGVSKIEHQLLPPPVKAFGAEECVDTESVTYRNPLQHYGTYSYSACVSECRTHFINSSCGCAHPIHKGFYTECNALESVSCAFPSYDAFYKNSAAIISSCGCPLPCKYTEFRTKLSAAYFPNVNFLKQNKERMQGNMQDIDYVRANYLSMSIYYDTKIVKTCEQILEFPRSDLMAAMSGYLSLAIGASVLTFLEFFEIFFIIVAKMFNQR